MKFQTVTLRQLEYVVLGFLITLLTACGSVHVPQERQSEQVYSHTITLEINSSSDAAMIVRDYNADVLVWQPEAGFAILGVTPDAFSTLSETDIAESSQDALRTPELHSNGFDAWAGGWHAWAGGFDAWAGGWHAWAGDHTHTPTTFGENLATWEQIHLAEAQQLAPKLGEGVTVAVIDTGIDLTHPAFEGKLAPVHQWKDFIDHDAYPQDEGHGHGTAVAGVILQVAPNVTILPIRILDEDGSGDLDDAILAIQWAVEQGADIINLSLGSDVDFKAMKEMMKWTRKEDVVVIASAGNYGQDLEFPARYKDESISVGSVNDQDIKSSFTAHGKELDLVAPGEVIYSLAPNAGIAYWSGTSFAAPIVTGAISLAYAELDEPLDDPKKVAQRLGKTADEIKDFGDNNEYKLGKGRLNIANFLIEILDIK